MTLFRYFIVLSIALMLFSCKEKGENNVYLNTDKEKKLILKWLLLFPQV